MLERPLKGERIDAKLHLRRLKALLANVVDARAIQGASDVAALYAAQVLTFLIDMFSGDRGLPRWNYDSETFWEEIQPDIDWIGRRLALVK
jgi:hypothetical protein